MFNVIELYYNVYFTSIMYNFTNPMLYKKLLLIRKLKINNEFIFRMKILI